MMRNGEEKATLLLSVDYGYVWPLSDRFFGEGEEVDWSSLISRRLIRDLKAWCEFFNVHADEETRLYGGEENRRWFELEGFRLLEELRKQAGHRFNFDIHLWF